MQPPAQHVGQTELADQALALGQLGAGIAEALDLLPVAGVERELPDRRVQLDLRGNVADLLRERKRLSIGRGRRSVVAVGALEVMPERDQRENRLVRV